MILINVIHIIHFYQTLLGKYCNMLPHRIKELVCNLLFCCKMMLVEFLRAIS